ncbi:MAG: zinc ribbon domain-containing protein [candidate division WOR-3 bacterium]|nr:MAG: zinc ribbon domain-containing protein [candidate division WOR-3 bacterium]
MPTYEYECLNCRKTLEEFQKITDDPLTRCPKCGGKLRRLISGGAGLIFKGNGFYVTDYKRSQLPEKKVEKGTQLKNPDDKPRVPAKVSSEKKD